MISLGAEGVIVGTRFLVAEECPLHPNIKNALLTSTELDTMLVMGSVGNKHRVWRNRAAEVTAEMEKKGASLEELFKVIGGDRTKKMYIEGDPDLGLMACGQGIGLVKEIKPVRDIIAEILQDAMDVRKRLNAI